MVRIRVPATSANVGPGFDCLGLALALYNDVEVSVSERLHIEIEGEGAQSIPRNGSNLLFKAYRRTMTKLGRHPENLSIRQINHIPSTRGLGSSSTAVVAGILAAQAIAGVSIPLEESLLIATQIEGHPDNVAPALYGGFVAAVGGTHDARALSFRAPHELVPVALIPPYELPTVKARAALPKNVSFADAVFNVSRASFLVAAMAKGDIDGLFSVLQDKLHQPYRAKLIQGFEDILASCESFGCPAYLSGAGPTMMALCRRAEVGVFSERIRGVLGRYGDFEILPLEVDNRGATVEHVEGDA
jgi:homoserine kinase